MHKVLIWSVLLLLPTGQALFNDPIPYHGEMEYTRSFAGLPALVSGAVDYHGDQAHNATMLLGTGGFTVSGLERLCWERSGGEAECRTGTGFEVELADGGSAAFRTPKTYNVELEAAHALAFFAEADRMFGDDRNEAIALGQSMVAFPTDESIVIDDVADLPPPAKGEYTDFNDARDDLALVMTLSDDSTLVLRHGGATIDTLSGDGRWVGFLGSPVFTPITANLAVLPMPDGAIASFTQAAGEAARRGLSADSLNAAFSSLQTSEGQSDANALEGIGDAADALAGFLNGALINLEGGGPGQAQGAADLLSTMTLVRFEEMEAERTDSMVTLDGVAPLQIQQGEVAGAQTLIGGVVPLWGVILWGIAMVLLVVRLVVRPDKHHALWDRFHLVGYLAGAITGIVVFYLWDRQMAALWGTSILSSNASGATLGAIAALQLIPLLVAGLFFGMPFRSIAKSSTRLLGQGRMMNIGNVVAPFITFLLGVPLILSLLDAILQMLSSSGV